MTPREREGNWTGVPPLVILKQLLLSCMGSDQPAVLSLGRTLVTVQC